MSYVAHENQNDIRETLASLMRGKILVLKPFLDTEIRINYQNNPNKYSGGKITLFQEFVCDRTSLIPTIVKAEPPMQISFSLSVTQTDRVSYIRQILASDEANEFYRSLNITDVRFFGERLDKLSL